MGRTGRDQPKVVQKVLADLKRLFADARHHLADISILSPAQFQLTDISGHLAPFVSGFCSAALREWMQFNQIPPLSPFSTSLSRQMVNQLSVPLHYLSIHPGQNNDQLNYICIVVVVERA